MTIRPFVSASLLGLTIATVASAPAVAAGSKSVRVVSVRALPTRVQMRSQQGALTTQALNTVAASTALAFQLRLRNDAPAARRHVSATVTIDRPVGLGGPVVHQATIAVIGPGQTRTVTIARLGAVPFAERTSLTVRVSGGTPTVYPVIFALPSGNGAPVSVSPANPATAARGAAEITVPSLVGTPQQAALTRLEQLGMQVLVVQVHSRRARTLVVAQSPRAGSRLTAGSIVTIDVSSGPKQR